MYAIIVKGEIIGFCDKPWYIKQIEGNNGKPLWTHTEDKADAEALSVRGTKYNLSDKGIAIEGAETALVIEKSEPEYTFQNMKDVKKVEETSEALEDAICDADLSMADRIATLEDVICELDMKGATN